MSIWPLSAVADDDLPRRPNAPSETYAHAEVIYDSVRDSRGDRSRVIVTRPRKGTGRYPAIFVLGWLSCDSVEAPADTQDASGKVFRALAELPGFVTVRMDKPRVGDSEAVCAETDFATELERIIALVNANLPGAASYVELPATGHTFEHYEILQAAFKFKESAFDPRNAKLVTDWFWQHR